VFQDGRLAVVSNCWVQHKEVVVLMPVITIMWPFFLSRITGRMALMMFTLAKKLISKISSTRLIVRLLCASSSTVPMTAAGRKVLAQHINQTRISYLR
jgi:hypothetical protein